MDSLRQQIKSLMKEVMKRIVGVVFCFWLWSCMQEDPEIGSNFFDDVSFEIVSWDTLTLNMYTVRFDSVQTHNLPRLMVGQAVHPTWGTIRSVPFFQIKSDELYDYDNLKDADFQNAYLTIYYDTYFYGDTTQLLQLEVYELSEEMELDDNSRLYNNSSFEVKLNEENEPKVLGSLAFEPRPFTKDSVEIPIDTEFADEFFRNLQADQMSEDDLLDYLKGFKLNSTSGSAVVGFQTAPVLKLHYLDKSNSPSTEETLRMEVGTGAIRFNQINASDIGDVVPESEEEYTSSAETDHKAYIQAGLGMAIRVELPYVKELLLIDQIPSIDKVELELVFENEIPEQTYMLQSGLSISIVDNKNRILEGYSDVSELVIDEEYDEEKKFVLDITSYVEYQLTVDVANADEALLIHFPQEDFLGTVNHLIVTDQTYDTKSSKIILNVLNLK